MNGLEGNIEFCFPRISMFPETFGVNVDRLRDFQINYYDILRQLCKHFLMILLLILAAEGLLGLKRLSGKMKFCTLQNHPSSQDLFIW